MMWTQARQKGESLGLPLILIGIATIAVAFGDLESTKTMMRLGGDAIALLVALQAIRLGNRFMSVG